MFCFSQLSAQAFADVFFVLETSKMSLVAYAAERAMVVDLVAQAQLLAVPGVVLLLVVLVPLLVGVVLGVQYQKFRAENRRVRHLQDSALLVGVVGQALGVFEVFLYAAELSDVHGLAVHQFPRVRD
ncbi:hypothetical protein AK812_SmicGene43981 [Symbiodinium microadriaticum]|uniref:Uncharacterized protein n=1 Tax=Symbiodinium microadriaticum TaxID=2951 RepID=A0A1Q9BZM2_SYMMI|nr:hypothetical protein AK812_SmicGene43981 [Symbiodinium microadriaticum]